MIFRLGMVFILLGTTAPVWALCDKQNTTYEINECLKSEIDKADRELNQTYQRIIASLKEPDKALLKTAQKAWVIQYEADLAFVKKHWSEGTYAGIRYGSTRYDLLQTRISQLNALVSP